MSHLVEDCLRIIFNKLKEDSASLYSCILVNRFWCCIAMAILWKNPFNRNSRSLYKMVIHSLPISSKQRLINNNIIIHLIDYYYKPLFNYIGFASQISQEFIDNMTNTLINEVNKFREIHERNVLKQEVYKLFINNCRNIKYFYWKTTQPLPQYPGASTCFSKLHSLDIDLQLVISTALSEMADICQNIKSLKLWNCNGDIAEGLIRFIDFQKNLKSLVLHFKDVEEQCLQLREVIERKASTLKKLTIEPDITLLSPKFFSSLINLQYLKLNNSNKSETYSIEMVEWEKYLSIASFPNLQYFESGLLPICNDYMLIEKSQGNILEINIYRSYKIQNFAYTEKLIKSISRYCPKLERLAIDAELENLEGIKEIFINCKRLKIINLVAANLDELIGDELLKVLIDYSPKTLYEVYFVNWNFTTEALKKFFGDWNNCDKKPLTFNISGYFTNVHRMIVSKYIGRGVIKKAQVI